MLRLALVRHGTAVSGAACADYDRQLDERGVQEARDTAAFLAEALQPRLVIASAARRTRRTAEAIRDACPGSRLQLDGTLYQASPEDWLEAIRLAPTQLDAAQPAAPLVLVGHQPVISATAAWLATEAEPLIAELGHFPPATAALLEFDPPEAGGWDRLEPGTGRLLQVRRAGR
ncbi:SixA phosphatase family protein [Sediminivirga luteola]|uniref:Phosphoglycerate mutase n=1 Tax=Sediminivirga luteola TaxID=1774748 RepID=A0A8J2U008_9MICO|nr:histidine phosphatase family protein [Sediminivirga luteola]MCI2264067.1 histidine phosphatase family protein [Sediminivirga luteola]GGA22623.1 phosphoglycerate mutase [Sediminivirga luteola]